MVAAMTRHGCAVLVFAMMASCGGARGGVSGDPIPMGCTAGTSEACSCESGASGTRTCQADGTFAACACAGEDAMVSMDATVVPDLPGSDLTLPDLPQSEPPAPDRMVTCSAPRLDCDNNAANGCETDTTTSASHCGRCNNACPAGRSCVAGVCSTASCPTGQTSCSGACVNTQNNTANCGACGTRCNAGDTCVSGRCTPPAGMCPSSCRTESDCAPCRTAGDPGNYCCISGLCLYMTGACGPVGTDGGSGTGDDVPDAGGGGGGDAAFD